MICAPRTTGGSIAPSRTAAFAGLVTAGAAGIVAESIATTEEIADRQPLPSSQMRLEQVGRSPSCVAIACARSATQTNTSSVTSTVAHILRFSVEYGRRMSFGRIRPTVVECKPGMAETATVFQGVASFAEQWRRSYGKTVARGGESVHGKNQNARKNPCAVKR